MLNNYGIGGGGSGTTDHTQLTNRDAENQHPMSSITGLNDALDDAETKVYFFRTGASYVEEVKELVAEWHGLSNDAKRRAQIILYINVSERANGYAKCIYYVDGFDSQGRYSDTSFYFKIGNNKIARLDVKPSAAEGSGVTYTEVSLATLTDLNAKSDKTAVVNLTDSSTTELADNTEYRGGTLAAFTITLPTMTGTFDSWISFTSGATATAFTFPTGIAWSGDDITDGEFVPAASKRYNIGLWYDGSVVNAIVRGVAT